MGLQPVLRFKILGFKNLYMTLSIYLKSGEINFKVRLVDNKSLPAKINWMNPQASYIARRHHSLLFYKKQFLFSKVTAFSWKQQPSCVVETVQVNFVIDTKQMQKQPAEKVNAFLLDTFVEHLSRERIPVQRGASSLSCGQILNAVCCRCIVSTLVGIMTIL